MGIKCALIESRGGVAKMSIEKAFFWGDGIPTIVYLAEPGQTEEEVAVKISIDQSIECQMDGHTF